MRERIGLTVVMAVAVTVASTVAAVTRPSLRTADATDDYIFRLDDTCAAPCATLHRVTAACDKAPNGSVAATTCGACLPGFDGSALPSLPCTVNEEYWTGDDDSYGDGDSDSTYSGHAPHTGAHSGGGPVMSMQGMLGSAFGSLVVLLMCVITWRGWLDCCCARNRRTRKSRHRAFLEPTTTLWTCGVCLHTNSSLRRYCVLCESEGVNDKKVEGEHATMARSAAVALDDTVDGSCVYVLVETPRAAARPTSRPFPRDTSIEWTEMQRLARDRLEWKRCIDKRTMRWVRVRAADVCRLPELRGTIVRAKDVASLENVITTSKNQSVQWTAPGAGFFVVQPSQVMQVWHPVERAEFDARPYKMWRSLQKIASMPFPDRLRWFHQELLKMRHTLGEDQFTIHVHRQNILKQTMQLFRTTPDAVLRRHLRVDFMDEPGVDGGGILREWLQLVCKELFSDALGLFKRTASTIDGGYWIHRTADRKSKSQLQMYVFFGKLLAKTVLEGLVLNVRLATPLLKHILGSPLSIEDLRFLDDQIYSSVRFILENDNVDELSLTFCVGDQDLISHGSEMAVTDVNKQLYVDHLIQYYLFDSIEQELRCIMEGFRSVLPTTPLHVFDYMELDLVVSGLEEIDVLDWQAHTNVCVLGHNTDQEERVVEWFWEIVQELDQRARSRLLQYVTGSSGVPVEGFAALTSLDGRLQPFTIQLRESGCRSYSTLPYASTCFNRLDLPIYDTKSDLKAMLMLLVEADVTGFNRR